MIRFYVDIAAFFQSVYRWNLEKSGEAQRLGVSNGETGVAMWLILMLVFLLCWFIGLLFTPCEWIQEERDDTLGYMFVAFTSSVLASAVINALVFLFSKRLKQRLREVNEEAIPVNFKKFALKVVIGMALFLAITVTVISLTRYNCGLPIFYEPPTETTLIFMSQQHWV